jgi:hypothetical protein
MRICQYLIISYVETMEKNSVTFVYFSGMMLTNGNIFE